MNDGQMTRGKTGPLTSFTKLPVFLDVIHSYGPASREVTKGICQRLLTSMLDWLESPEVVKELIKFDSSKMTVFAGRLENYHYLYTELQARHQYEYLEPFIATCKERYEYNLQAFIQYIYDKIYFSVSEFFTAMLKMKKTIPAEEIQFQVSLSRAAFASLNKKYNVAAWEKKLAKAKKIIQKNISISMQATVWDAFKDFILSSMALFQDLITECYGKNTSFSVNANQVSRMFDALK